LGSGAPAAGVTPRPRVAVFNTFPMLPALTGSRQRALRLCSGFAQWADVSYLCNRRQRGRTEQQVAPQLAEIVLPMPWWQRRGQQVLERLVPDRVFDVAHLVFAPRHRALVQTAAQLAARADIVVFTHPYLWPALRGCFDPARQLLVYDAHDVELVVKRQLLGSGRVAAMLLERLRAAEGELLARADLVVVVSDDDAAAFAAEYGADRARMVLARNGVDLASALPWRGAEPGARPTAVFMGSAYGPNDRAARYIVGTLAPAVPEADFVIAGHVCGSIDGLRRPANVVLKGPLPEADKAGLLARADLALNPVVEGSGTSVKMLDFMGAGLPVVSTPQGARGLGVEHGREAQLCELEAFPGAVRALLADGATRRRLGTAARRFVEERYRWDRIVAALGAVLRERLHHHQQGRARPAGAAVAAPAA
jgi:glycosyltransferase involved in cell wall biosynthesis